MATNVFVDDRNLAFLGRFATWPEDGDLLNVSKSIVYSGLNTFEVSGTPIRMSGIPLPSGSGVYFDSPTAIFHLSSDTGNMSGMDMSATSKFSIGLFGRLEDYMLFDRTFFAKHSSSVGGAFYRLQISSGSPTDMNWEFTVGGLTGDSSYVISSPYAADITKFESVVATMDPSTTTAILYVSGLPVASSTSLTPSPGTSGKQYSPIRIGAHRSFSSMGTTI